MCIETSDFKNKAANQKMLFHTFDLFSNVEYWFFFPIDFSILSRLKLVKSKYLV